MIEAIIQTMTKTTLIAEKTRKSSREVSVVIQKVCSLVLLSTLSPFPLFFNYASGLALCIGSNFNFTFSI